ncbi:DUF2829 domain-containing protein [Faecalibacillus intestinalis]|uniref:DUF2829 domain-containing protein n=1 Tax=Faecalibacillus intestinalis TaxID=1982626 RepID=UPI000E543E37|nr:DUF2829 domain-containing protein [Faecalibacillus intestinalis]RHT88214.1 DUF2829 domain-containing protein [Coprobacillus sp. AM28-15LB]
MEFKKALELMKQGMKMKLPSWGGYWFYDNEKEAIIMHTKEGKELDIRETDRVEYTTLNICSNDWMVANEENCPELGGFATFGFDEAIKYLKRGLKVKRKGWNGKEQYIELATNVSFKTPNDEVINVDHVDMGNKAIAFHGTSGIQLGWLASQSDMLSNDWIFAEEN